MCRILAVLVALGCLALAAAPSAQGQAPTIVTDIIFPEEGNPFGTFTASDPTLCPSGTFVDQGSGFAGAIRKNFTCADGSGTFTILFRPLQTPVTPAGCEIAGPFVVVGGTGDYARLRGRGDFCAFAPGGENEFRETFTGRFRLG